MRQAQFAIVAFFAVLFGLLSSPTRAASTDLDPDIVELIVLFKSDGAEVILPEDVIDLVASASDASKSSMTADDWALFTRLGSPVAARWLIELRLSDEYLADLRKFDPDHPEVKLQEFVLLRYADASGRANARERLKGDPSISSVAVNTSGGFSLRTNDTYVLSGPGAAPTGYQWALDTLGAMNPVSNPSQTSAWDKATGFGYVAIVDSGIMTSHPDLQRNFKQHFSQSFYSGACSGSLVDVDEGGASSNCPNSLRGHGTHIAGIIAATPNNSSGVAGLCWDCSLIIAKANSLDVPRVADRINGLNHAVMRGAQFANFSGQDNSYLPGAHGGTVTRCQVLPNPDFDAYCLALKTLRLREVMLVAASGNESIINDYVDFPAREPDSIAVGATKNTGHVWFNETGIGGLGSNLGTTALTGSRFVDFVAPGAVIVSSFYLNGIWNDFWPDPWRCRDNLSPNSYDTCSGTSMAAPHFLGVAAVARSINPLATVPALKTLLTSTSTNVTPPSVQPPAIINPPGGFFKQPNMLNAVNSAISIGFVWPAFAMVTKNSSSNRFTTAIPQMARAAVGGTMLPTLIHPVVAPVEYKPDPSAPAVAGYPAFPNWVGTPTAYFKVYTKLKTSSTNLRPLYRLSKLQNLGSGTDACGTPMPVPSKPEPVIHFYTTNKSERDALIAATYGNCFRYDGIEGYVAPWDLGGLQQLFRIYNPTTDSWILVPSSHLPTANGLGFTQQQSSLGWVVPN
jgi:hypothetical protein